MFVYMMTILFRVNAVSKHVCVHDGNLFRVNAVSKHVCVHDDNLFRVNAVSKWTKGNTYEHEKADDSWRHQRFVAKTSKA